MIERIWSGRSPLYLLLLPLSLLYGVITALIRLSYRLGLRKAARAGAGGGGGKSYSGRQR